MRRAVQLASLLLVTWILTSFGRSDALGERADAWRSLPLITDGKVDKSWVQIGGGGFAVDNGTLRTMSDATGMGLLLYDKERFGDCQLRIVYKCKDAKSNSGVFVRIGDRIRDKAREKSGADSLKAAKLASKQDRGPWYAVHHGYEVQICDDGDAFHRTGAIYSLAKAAPVKPSTDWRTMVITLKGNLVLVDVDGQHVTTFDPDGKDVPAASRWYEPRREPKRPLVGYIGLQNHDPGDVVYFKEISVRPLAKSR